MTIEEQLEALTARVARIEAALRMTSEPAEAKPPRLPWSERDQAAMAKESAKRIAASQARLGARVAAKVARKRVDAQLDGEGGD